MGDGYISFARRASMSPSERTSRKPRRGEYSIGIPDDNSSRGGMLVFFHKDPGVRLMLPTAMSFSFCGTSQQWSVQSQPSALTYLIISICFQSEQGDPSGGEKPMHLLSAGWRAYGSRIILDYTRDLNHI